MYEYICVSPMIFLIEKMNTVEILPRSLYFSLNSFWRYFHITHYF